MRITLISVGRMKSGPEKDLVDDYVTRFNKIGRNNGFRGLDVIEVESGGGRNAEGERLLARIPDSATVCRLDEHGTQWPSKTLANQLATWRDQGISDLVFLIGGAEGYSSQVENAVSRTLAFGPQTWPHRLVRVMIAEQVYRAASILAGSPYHKA